MTVVKLGGSIISDKSVDFSYREDVVSRLAKSISRSGEPVVLVHGGGSFGHPLAKKYGLSSSRSRPDPEGVSQTREVMFALNARVCESLSKGGLRPYTFTPFPLLGAAGARGLAWIRGLLDSGLTPVTFGDVVSSKKGFTILSGDTISLELCRRMRARRCIFVMDVDGILDESGRVIRELGKSDAEGLLRSKTASSKARRSDVTGGIRRKVEEAMRIASAGTEVAFVSGFRPAEFSKALKRVGFHGTIIRVPSP